MPGMVVQAPARSPSLLELAPEDPENGWVWVVCISVPLLATGLNHRSASIDLRERAAFAPELLPAALEDLVAQPSIEEGLIVSTCNRTEIYTVGGHPEQLSQWLERQRQLPASELAVHSYSKTGSAAAQHALRVACGLDSLVLGEPQILGQMKVSWQAAREQGTLGPVLERLFQHAFGTAKLVRSATALGAGQVSVAAVAARIAEEIFGSLEGMDVLLIGAGETAELMARYIHGLGKPRLTICNRNTNRAQALAERFSAAACPLPALPQFLASADVVVGCVTADRPLLDAAALRTAFQRRRRKPVLFLDLGVPRNFHPEIAKDEDVFLYGVDDLQSRVEAGAAGREAAAADAERIVDNRTEEFAHWLLSRELDLGLTQVEQAWSESLAPLSQKALSRLAAGDAPEEVLRRLQYNVLQRLLHAPRRHVRELPAEQRARAVSALQRALNLGDTPPPDAD